MPDAMLRWYFREYSRGVRIDKLCESAKFQAGQPVTDTDLRRAWAHLGLIDPLREMRDYRMVYMSLRRMQGWLFRQTAIPPVVMQEVALERLAELGMEEIKRLAIDRWQNLAQTRDPFYKTKILKPKLSPRRNCRYCGGVTLFTYCGPVCKKTYEDKRVERTTVEQVCTRCSGVYRARTKAQRYCSRRCVILDMEPAFVRGARDVSEKVVDGEKEE
jgi:hypothetical protein